MQITKQMLKKIIKEELDAMMSGGENPGRSAAAEIEEAGAIRAYDYGKQRTKNLGYKAMTYDYNNSYTVFDDGKDIYIFYVPHELAGKVPTFDILEKYGFTRGSFAIPLSNQGAPVEYEKMMKNRPNPNRRVVGI